MFEQYEEFYVTRTNIVTTFVSHNTLSYKLYHIQLISCNTIHHVEYVGYEFDKSLQVDDKNSDDKKT